MLIETWAIDRPQPYALNPRRNARAVAKVADSLQAFGWQQPLVVDAHGIVVVGHTRLAAAKQLGMTEVPVYVAAHLTPEQADAYRIADNRIPEGASWDFEALAVELRDMRDLGVALSTTAMPAHEIATLLAAEPVTKLDRSQTNTGQKRIVLTPDQLGVVQQAADRLDPPAKDLGAAVVRLCAAYLST